MGLFCIGVGMGQGEVTWENLSMEEFIMREDNFHEGAQDFLALFKRNNEKINICFSTGSNEQH